MSVADFKNIIEKGYSYTMPSFEKDALTQFASLALERKINNIVTEIDTVPKQIREEDVKNVEEKCEKINCMAVYEAIVATIKLIYDILFCCCKKKD